VSLKGTNVAYEFDDDDDDDDDGGLHCGEFARTAAVILMKTK
jgi:hypothetical protein